MAKFFYTVKLNNQLEQGYINALALDEAVQALESKGCVILEISEVYFTRNSDLSSETVPLSLNEKKEFFNAFYMQYKAGLSATEVFNAIASSANSEHVKLLSMHIYYKITNGCPFADTIRQYAGFIGNMYAILIVAGDRSGKLEETLEGIIRNINKMEKVKEGIINKLNYPALLVCMLIVATIIMNCFVFNVLNDTFRGESAPIFKYIVETIVFIIVTFLIIAGFSILAYKNRDFRAKIVNKLMNIAPIRKLVDLFSYFNFFYMLALTYNAGVPIKESIAMCSILVKNSFASVRIDKMIDMISQGAEVETAFKVSGLFSGFANSQISAGETAGQLDKAFKSIASDYEIQFSRQIDVVVKLIEPTLITLIGFVVLILGYKFFTIYSNVFSGL